MGIEEHRILELPPGVNLDQWRPQPTLHTPGALDGPLRVLFVGGDFTRKGGDTLLEVASLLAEDIEVDIVTRDPVSPQPGVRIHRAEANTPELRSLYARADLFVLPTRAECFGIATVEAMASGLPVIVGDVGGARSIVQEGVNGWLIPPDREGLSVALHSALANRQRLAAMGAAGRRRTELCFDGARNDRVIADLAVALASGQRALREGFAT
jgi:glycosyltransferase involved in cell wall biosynthesis